MESRICRNQIRNSSESCAMLFDGFDEEIRVVGLLLVDLVTGDDLVFRFLDFHHLPKFGGLTGLAFSDDFSLRFKDANDLFSEVRVVAEYSRFGLLHHASNQPSGSI